MSFLLEIREAAKQVFDDDLRHDLRAAADNLDVSLKALAKLATREAMTEANGDWAHAERMMKRLTKPGGTVTGGAMREGAKLQAPEPERLAA